MDRTERINKILKHKDYVLAMNIIKEYEEERIFCIHDIEHFLSVARIMYIKVLEDKVNDLGDKPKDELTFDKEIIYATALLHDIGRAKQYVSNESHDIASAYMAEKILIDTGFNQNEIDVICDAICGHNNEEGVSLNSLGVLLKYADKESRNCFECEAYKECNWKEERKNKEIKQ